MSGNVVVTMTNEEAIRVLLYDDWYNELPANWGEGDTEDGKKLLDAIETARIALRYNVKIEAFTHKNLLKVTVPKDVKVSRVLVLEEGTQNSKLYYSD